MYKIKTIFMIMMLTLLLGAKTRPWISLSSLWGQGGAGITSRQESYTLNLKYYFVLDWKEPEITYHEISKSIDYEDFTLGFKYRYQLSKDEYTPFLGYFYQKRYKYPFTFYSEAEYRINSIVNDSDYLRTRHIATIYATDTFCKRYSLRPYVSLDSFVDWSDASVEKVRLNIGYFMNFEKVKVRVYFLPWTWGEKEEEWDDNSWVGATVQYLW